jgi:hypothetical protein
MKQKSLFIGFLCSFLTYFTNAQPVVAVNNLASLGDGNSLGSGLVFNNIPFFGIFLDTYGGSFTVKGNNTDDLSWQQLFEVDIFGNATVRGNLTVNGNYIVNGAYNIPGTLAVGTTNLMTGSFKMIVEGKMGAREIQVTTANPWPDYVFDSAYHLLSLYDVEKYINQNGHLPEVPSAEKVKKEGFDVATMNATLLQKIEELTLHMIELKKEVDELKVANQALQKKAGSK